MHVTRIYTGDDGQSHFDDIEVDMGEQGLGGFLSDPWAASAVQFREVPNEYHLDFHCAPRRQLVVNLTGSVEIETGAGDTRLLGPGTVLLAEDVTGQGHISRHVTDEPRTCLFIHLD